MAPELVWEGFGPSAAIGGLLIAAFSLIIGILARFRGAAKHYVLFGVGFGVAAFLGHMVIAMQAAVGIPFNAPLVSASDYTAQMLRWAVPLHLLAAAGYAVATIGVFGLLRAYNGWSPRLALVGATVSTVQLIAFMVLAPGFVAGWPLVNAVARALDTAAVYVLIGILAMGSVSLAHAYARDRDPNQAVLGIALALYPILNGLWAFTGLKLGGAPQAWILWSPLVFAVWIFVAWIGSARQTAEPAARNVVRLIVLCSVIAIAMSPFPKVLHLGGLARVLDILIIAYAILRYQYLGLDIKIRWGISKTTIAALFIAVFFVVSELAANIFSEQWGTEIGIAAAGALVFAIAPIMRWADRFANAAIPGVVNGDDIYRNSLRLALKDGTIDAHEEEALAAQADQLGISAQRMIQLRREAELNGP